MRNGPGLLWLLACLSVASVGDAFAQTSILERQQAMFRRNVGTPAEQRAQFPPHRIIGNLYYVGSQSLASFLVTTPEGHILINTNWEDGVPNLRQSVEDLGFEFDDIRIVLGSHAHADHMQGDALVKAMTDAQVMAMAMSPATAKKAGSWGIPRLTTPSSSTWGCRPWMAARSSGACAAPTRTPRRRASWSTRTPSRAIRTSAW